MWVAKWKTEFILFSESLIASCRLSDTTYISLKMQPFGSHEEVKETRNWNCINFIAYISLKYNQCYMKVCNYYVNIIR